MELTKNLKKVSLSNFFPLPEGKNQYSTRFMETWQAIVLKEGKNEVIVGICNPLEAELEEILFHFHDSRIIFVQIDHRDLSGYLSGMHSQWGKGSFSPGDNQGGKLLLDRVTQDAPVINFVNNILIEGMRKGASDIHIEAFSSYAKVRYRIDGILNTQREFDISLFPSVSSRIKIMGNLNIAERRRPQDGRISVHLGDDVQDIRVSVVPTVKGESIAMRLLNPRSFLPDLDSLGFDNKSLGDIRRIISLPSGLILAAGPTGSGKTTTLNSMLREMDRQHRKIITVEDPVEYIIEGIDQVQTNPAAGLTFGSVLRRFLRQDPDILMVGEIRDRETAELAVRAALTGHLVLSTLHTNDAVSVIPRLVNLGIEPFLIAAVLKTALSQRLVRTLCPYCKRGKKPNSLERAILRKAGYSGKTIFSAAGCSKCENTGYKGRTLLYEYFFVDDEIENLIVKGGVKSEIKDFLKKTGNRFLFDNGIKKVVQGFTTLEELGGVMVLS